MSRFVLGSILALIMLQQPLPPIQQPPPFPFQPHPSVAPAADSCNNSVVGTGLTCTVSVISSGDSFTNATPPFTSSGNLEVIMVSDYFSGNFAGCTPQDNRNSALTFVRSEVNLSFGGAYRMRMWYVFNPSVGPGHVISCGFPQSDTYPAMIVSFYQTPGGFTFAGDQGAASPRFATSASIPPLVPAESPALLVGGCIGSANVSISAMNPANSSGSTFTAHAETTAALQSTCSAPDAALGVSFIVAAFHPMNLPPPATMMITQQPSNTVVGQTITPPIHVTLSNYATDTLVLTPEMGTCTFSGMLMVQALPTGATFANVVPQTAGNACTVRIHNMSNPAVMDVISNAFNVVPPPATLTFTVQPSSTAPGATMMPPVQVQSSNLTFNGTITLMLVCSGASATGLMATATNGHATFPSIMVSGNGLGCHFTASAPGMTPVNSNYFNVAPIVPGGARPIILGGGIL